MKKIIAIAFAAVMAIVVGCKSVPSVETMASTATAVGYAAGMVANGIKIDDASRNVVIDIVNKVESCIPETNQTFDAAWTPIAKAHVTELVKQGKIDQAQGDLIVSAFGVAVKGIDYLFDVRYPKAREYQDLVEAAVHGFCGGFLYVFKPANMKAGQPVAYDKAAFDYLKAAK